MDNSEFNTLVSEVKESERQLKMAVTAADYTLSLYETMKTFSDSWGDELKKSTTNYIKGTIREIIDLGAGRYKLEYLENTFEVFSNNADYGVGDNVYVAVPNGDFSETKYIVGLVDPEATTFLDNTDIESIYYDISGNLITETAYNSIKLNSYLTTYSNTIPIDNIARMTLKEMMNDYKTDYIFAFGFDVRTSLPLEQQNSGNYGMILDIPLAVDLGGGNIGHLSKQYVLDVTNMLGSPYRLEEWSPQVCYFTIDKQYTVDIDDPADTTIPEKDRRVPKISYFCKDFIQDESKKYITTFDDNGNEIEVFDENGNKIPYYDIEIKDIYLKVVDELQTDETSGFSLTLKASEGIYFLPNRMTQDTKTIIPTLRINGKETSLKPNTTTSVDKSKDPKIYWFVEHSGIRVDSSDYCNYGGIGWKCLNEKINIAEDDLGNQTFDWVTDVVELTIKREDVFKALRYKCVVVYKDFNISQTITIKNMDGKADFTLESSADNNVYIKETGLAHLYATVYIQDKTDKPDETDPNNIKRNPNEAYRTSIIYSWSRYNKRGSLITDNDSEVFKEIAYNKQVTRADGKLCYQTEVTIPVNRIEDYNDIWCTVSIVTVKENTEDNSSQIIDTILVGTEKIRLATSEEFQFSVNIDNENVVYKYDAYGKSPAGTAYTGSVTSRIMSIAPLNFTIRKMTGEELTNEEYSYVNYEWRIPRNSLFKVEDTTKTTQTTTTEVSETTEEDTVADNRSFDDKSDPNYIIISGTDNTTHTGGILKYKIEENYNISKIDEPIILTVDIQGFVIKKAVNITFIKEGQNGTNGTAYSCLLCYNENFDQADQTGEENSVQYGKLDEYGLETKLKILYSTAKAQWYVINNKGEIGLGSEKIGKIYPKVYQDGEKLKYGLATDNTDTFNDYSVIYNMFDPDTTNPYLKVAGIDGYGGVRLTFDTDKLNETDDDGNKINNITMDTISCNILQARITINKGNDSLMDNKRTIYTYYPIEFSIIDFDPMNEPGAEYTIPCLEGGYSEVIYENNGSAPQCDNDSFKIVNCANIVSDEISEDNYNTYFQFKWQSSEKLGGVEDSEFNSETSKTIKPNDKFDDGKSQNYVMVDIKKIYTDIDLTSKKQELNNIITPISNNLTRLNNNKTYLRDFINTWNDYSDNEPHTPYHKLQGLEDFLQYRNESLNKLNILESYSYVDLRQYVDSLIKYYTVDNKQTYPNVRFDTLNNRVNALKNNIVKARNNLKFSSTTNEQDYKNNLQSVIKIESIDIGANEFAGISNSDINTLAAYIESVNLDIADYAVPINALKTVIEESNPTALADYLGIKTQIQDACNQISSHKDSNEIEKPFDNYLQMVTNIENYLKLINENLSAKNLLGLLDDIYSNCLSGIFSMISNNTLGFKESLVTEFSNKETEYNAQKKGYEDTYTALTRLILMNAKNIRHIRPIIMYYNRYGFSFLNDWDGNKLEIHDKDEDGRQYLLAPMIGAGKKDEGGDGLSSNGFTGIVFGQRNFETKNSLTGQVGMFGLNKGIQTMFLDAETGTAVFGSSNQGQIVIDPSAKIGEGENEEAACGLIYSAKYFKSIDKKTGRPITSSGRSGDGMCINLTQGKIHLASADNALIYSGEHETLENSKNKLGFYLSHDGLSISGYSYKKDEQGNYILDQQGNKQIDDEAAKNSFIAKTQGDIELYTGKHASLDDTFNEGLYISNQGISIVGKKYTLGENNEKRSQLKLKVDGDPVICSGGFQSFADTTAKGFHLSSAGIGVQSTTGKIYLKTGDANDSNPVIYSGNFSNIAEPKIGFHLSHAGLGVKSSTGQIILNTNGNPVIYSGNFSSIKDPKKGFHLSQAGLGIKSSTGQIILETDDGTPVIYSGSHSSLDKTNKGFYLGDDGLSIGSGVNIDTTGILLLGKGSKQWTIDGSSTNSYISYGDKGFLVQNVDDFSKDIKWNGAGTYEIYIGTNGIRLGNKFAVSDQGNLIAHGGRIGGWKIEATTLSAKNIVIDSDGSIGTPTLTGDKGWHIKSDGTATFNDITANGGQFNNCKIADTCEVLGQITFSNGCALTVGSDYTITKTKYQELGAKTLATREWCLGENNGFDGFATKAELTALENLITQSGS